MSDKIYLVDGRRTPFGKFGGTLGQITPVDLAVSCSKALLESSSLKPEDIDQVIFANVVPATTDTMYAGRHLALKLGCPVETPGYIVNRLCGSGIEAIMDAVRLIKLGEANCILASGAENMTMIPHLTYGARFGTKYGALKSVDMLFDTLTDQFCQTPMGITAENLSEKFGISREECDEFSMMSHHKASRAYAEKKFVNEVSPIEVKRGQLEVDEHLRNEISIEEMKKLRPSFKKDGVVTPASASGIVDGASSVIIASEKFCNEKGLSPIAEIKNGSVVGVEPTLMGIGPSPSIKMLLEKSKLNLKKDIDLVEINEAFAAQTLACAKDLDLDLEKLNIWGGAIALGHPLGATGLRITTTLAKQLKDNKQSLGIASACIGGGQGIAILIERVS